MNCVWQSQENKKNEAGEQMVCFVDGKENPSFGCITKPQCVFSQGNKRGTVMTAK